MNQRKSMPPEVHWEERKRDGWPWIGVNAVPERVFRTDDPLLALRVELENTFEGMRRNLDLTRGACYAFAELLPSVRREIRFLLDLGVPEVPVYVCVGGDLPGEKCVSVGGR